MQDPNASNTSMEVPDIEISIVRTAPDDWWNRLPINSGINIVRTVPDDWWNRSADN